MDCCNKSDKEAGQPPKSMAPRGIGAKWPYFCAAGLAFALIAVSVFKVSPANLLFYGAILACPLLHLVMMKNHAKGNDHHKTPDK